VFLPVCFHVGINFMMGITFWPLACTWLAMLPWSSCLRFLKRVVLKMEDNNVDDSEMHTQKIKNSTIIQRLRIGCCIVLTFVLVFIHVTPNSLQETSNDYPISLYPAFSHKPQNVTLNQPGCRSLHDESTVFKFKPPLLEGSKGDLFSVDSVLGSSNFKAWPKLGFAYSKMVRGSIDGGLSGAIELSLQIAQSLNSTWNGSEITIYSIPNYYMRDTPVRLCEARLQSVNFWDINKIQVLPCKFYFEAKADEGYYVPFGFVEESVENIARRFIDSESNIENKSISLLVTSVNTALEFLRSDLFMSCHNGRFSIDRIQRRLKRLNQPSTEISDEQCMSLTNKWVYIEDCNQCGVPWCNWYNIQKKSFSTNESDTAIALSTFGCDMVMHILSRASMLVNLRVVMSIPGGQLFFKVLL